MTNSAQRLVFWVERFLKRIVSTIGFLVVLLASPGVSLAQDPSVATVDEDKIRECVQSIETSRALINIYVSDDACVLAETYRCVRLNKQSGRPLNDVMRDCGEAELEIWEKLLKQTY